MVYENKSIFNKRREKEKTLADKNKKDFELQEQSFTMKQIKHQPFMCTWTPHHPFPTLLFSKASLTLETPDIVHCCYWNWKRPTQASIFLMPDCIVPARDCWQCGPHLHLLSLLTLTYIKWGMYCLSCLTPWLWLLADRLLYSISIDECHQVFTTLQSQ